VNPESSYLPPEIGAAFDWPALLEGSLHAGFVETILPGYVPGRRWFGGKARLRRGFAVAGAVPFTAIGSEARLLFVRVEYVEGAADLYALPLQTATGEAARRMAEAVPRAAVAWFRAGEDETLLYDALYDDGFRAALLRTIAEERSFGGRVGELHGVAASGLAERLDGTGGSRVLEVEQSNSSIIYDGRFFLKLYRRVEEGVNPDAELTRFLSERQHFAQVPPFAGSLEYRRADGPASVLALLVGLVPNQGDAWASTLEALRGFHERVLVARPDPTNLRAPSLFGDAAVSPELQNLLGAAFAERIRLLGQRTAEMHRALAADSVDSVFAPEPLTAADREQLCQSMSAAIQHGLAALRRQLPALPEIPRAVAVELADREGEILARHRRLLDRPIVAVKTRIHGDYHLGQTLDTGADFVILDFEGEPARPLAERKLKASPLRDVAGMLRSFGYASRVGLKAQPGEQAELLTPWTQGWERIVSRIYLDAYLETAAGAAFLPEDSADLSVLLESFLFDKAIYEVGYELNNRPDWLPIPVSAMLDLLVTP
jgi:maltose alpha-D-glucosyltransferase/alpha-amylase